MANVRDSDISLWLHNKLGTSNDSWTSGSICSQLNPEVLRNIKDCFPDLQTQVKLKLLLSFFHIPRRNVDEWRVELEEIVEVAQVDSELWVSMLAEMMKTLPSTGSLNTVISENEQNKRIFSDLVNDLKKLVRKQNESTMLPLECHYLNKSALQSLVGQQPAPVKHFTLKRKPKSAALRAELLQKSVDAASNLKKSAAPTVPVRSRGMPRKMTDTTPLKGIPSRVPTGGFQSSLVNNPLSRPSLPRNPTPRKDGGIKLLDINEQPMAYAQAKKRKKLQEIEDTTRKSSEGGAGAVPGPTASATPDYAVGLVPPPTPGSNLPQPASQPSLVQTVSSSLQQITNNAEPQPSTLTTPSYAPQTNAVVGSIIQTSIPLATTLTTATTPASIPVTPVQSESIVFEVEKPIIVKPTVVAIQQKPVEEKKFSLTRDQFVEAQEIFRSANKVTRPEKALILGFIAGARENPCPHLGNIVTIKLSENQIQLVENTRAITKIVETHFQMNYSNGEWKTLKKEREVETI